MVTIVLAELIRKVDTVQLCVPFSLRGFPSDLKSLHVNNDFACVPLRINFPKQDNCRVSVFKRSHDGVVFPDGERYELDKEQLGAIIKSAMRDAGRSVRNKRAKFEAVGWHYMMKYFLFLLRYPLNYKPTRVATYYSAVLSLVPGPKEKFTFDLLDSKG